jgi:hypothetical protein
MSYIDNKIDFRSAKKIEKNFNKIVGESMNKIILRNKNRTERINIDNRLSGCKMRFKESFISKDNISFDSNININNNNNTEYNLNYKYNNNYNNKKNNKNSFEILNTYINTNSNFKGNIKLETNNKIGLTYKKIKINQNNSKVKNENNNNNNKNNKSNINCNSKLLIENQKIRKLDYSIDNPIFINNKKINNNNNNISYDNKNKFNSFSLSKNPVKIFDETFSKREKNYKKNEIDKEIDEEIKIKLNNEKILTAVKPKIKNDRIIVNEIINKNTIRWGKFKENKMLNYSTGKFILPFVSK